MTSAEGRRRVRIERGIYRQGNGKFAVWVMVAGRPRFRTVDAATVAEARQRRALLQMLAASGELPLSPKLTFSEVAARWLAEFERKVASDTRRERTVDLYRSQLRLYLLPTFGRRRIGTIGPDDVARFAGDLSTRGLSAWSIKRLLGALSCVLSFALRRGYISRHPFAALTRDERPHPRSSEQRVLTRSELARLLSACPPRYRPLLVTAAYTGMRLSELLGLAWDDVDFRAGVVRVRHQLARSRGGVPAHRVAPKTAASVREIPLLPQLAAVLREQRRGSSFTASSDYVFVSGRGTPLLHHNVSKRVLRRAAAAARARPRRPPRALPRPTPHVREPPDHRRPPRRRPGEPDPRTRAYEHDARHLHAPVRAGTSHAGTPRRARQERVRDAARPALEPACPRTTRRAVELRGYA